MSKRSWSGIDVLLGVAAVSLVGWVIARDVLLPNRAAGGVDVTPSFVHGWEDATMLGREIGDSSATFRVVEFIDLQCPGCADYHERAYREYSQTAPQGSYSWRIVHFPLRSHPHAVGAAVAAECAAVQGRFAEFLDSALARQSSFGSLSWSRLAWAAGVKDTIAFARCLGDSSHVNTAVKGRLLGDRSGVRGTPSFIVNGWRMPSPPSVEELKRMQLEVEAGRPPVKGSKAVP